MPSAKRERQKQGRAVRREAILAAQKKRARQRQIVVFVGIVVVTVGLLVVLGVFNKSDNGKTKVAATTKSAAPCPKLTGQARRAHFDAPQRKCINTRKTYLAKVNTDIGTFTVTLDDKRAPTTVNNFVVLARYHYYDGLTFHRVVKDFVVQGGDPEGNGKGGPGYSFSDESLPGTTYPAASVAMANSGANTNGSQFFVVTTDAGGKGLQPNYTRFGTVTDGMDVVKKMNEDPGVVGSQTGEAPPHTVHKILKIDIEEH